jgi:hypothetical protein
VSLFDTFVSCCSLSTSVIPSGLEELSAWPLVDTEVRFLSIQDGNRHLRIGGDFLLNFVATAIRRHFGDSNAITIPKTVEKMLTPSASVTVSLFQR